MYLANSLPTEIQLKRMETRYKAIGARCEMIDNCKEMFKRWPMLDGDDLKVLFVYNFLILITYLS